MARPRPCFILAAVLLLSVVVIDMDRGTAHIQPSATPGPSLSPAPAAPVAVPTAPLPLEQRIAALEAQAERPMPKDVWDKANAISGLVAGGLTFLSGLAIAGVGGYATHIYRERQQAAEHARKEREIGISQAAMVQSFGAHLLSQEKREAEFAIGMIAAVDARLATDLALIVGGDAGFDALYRIVTIAAGTPEQQAVAQQRLEELGRIRARERLQTIMEETRASQAELEAIFSESFERRTRS